MTDLLSLCAFTCDVQLDRLGGNQACNYARLDATVILAAQNLEGAIVSPVL